MNTTIKRTHQRSDPFSRVPKDVLALPHLSWKAKGILAYLLGKPSNWKIRQLDLLSLLVGPQEPVAKQSVQSIYAV